MWFRDLVGFDESDGDTVRSQLRLDGEELTSTANGRTIGVGTLTTPSVAELRSLCADTGPGTLLDVVADVGDLHADPTTSGATFQVASQFNLLEMPSPEQTPEAGVAGYEHDQTQGPACAMACGGGTIFRNWFVPVGDQIGQTEANQLDCLGDLGGALGNDNESIWAMRNGYCLPSKQGLGRVRAMLDSATPGERDHLAGFLRVGLHSNVEVTSGVRGSERGHKVTQIYGSALPVAYGDHEPRQWEPFARLVLDASYEATLRAAHLEAASTGNATVFLTLLGGGVFGNERPWIEDAIDRAIQLVGAGLDIRLVARPA